MYHKSRKVRSTSMDIYNVTEGEMLETKIERIVNNKEPIKDGAPIIFTERKEGVRPSTNIRTDRFEIAVEAADKIAGSYKARREERGKMGEKKEDKSSETKGGATDSGAKPIQGETK